jgi:indolepyruvate ferredoxin oxidoreductase beta subunit
MNTINLVLCGLGGQGILFMTKVLSQTALRKGYNVVSHLRLGDVQGSLVKTGSAHLLFALEENEGYRNLPFLSPGGRLFVNTASPSFPREEVKGYLADNEIICRGIPADSIAMSLGVPLGSNLALLGYFSGFGDEPFSHDELKATIEEISPDRFRENNLKVFNAGFERGMEEKGD